MRSRIANLERWASPRGWAAGYTLAESKLRACATRAGGRRRERSPKQVEPLRGSRTRRSRGARLREVSRQPYQAPGHRVWWTARDTRRHWKCETFFDPARCLPDEARSCAGDCPWSPRLLVVVLTNSRGAHTRTRFRVHNDALGRGCRAAVLSAESNRDRGVPGVAHRQRSGGAGLLPGGLVTPLP